MRRADASQDQREALRAFVEKQESLSAANKRLAQLGPIARVMRARRQS